MVVIVGILAFMVSPGKWIVTGNFFDGFFNQTYWPQLLMRTALMFSIGAAYAIAVASRVKKRRCKTVCRKSSIRVGDCRVNNRQCSLFLLSKDAPRDITRAY